MQKCKIKIKTTAPVTGYLVSRTLSLYHFLSSSLQSYKAVRPLPPFADEEREAHRGKGSELIKAEPGLELGLALLQILSSSIGGLFWEGKWGCAEGCNGRGDKVLGEHRGELEEEVHLTGLS